MKRASAAAVITVSCLSNAVGLFDANGQDRLWPYGAAQRERARPATMVRALIIADTLMVGENDEDTTALQAAARKDLEAMTWLLREAFASKPNQLKLTTLSGEQVTPEDVRNYFDALPRSVIGETLFVYYSGHGGLDPERGRYMSMTNGVLLISELQDMMDKRFPQLRVIMADCCIKVAPLPPAMIGEPDVALLSTSRRVNEARVLQLLLEQAGEVEAFGAQQGELAFCREDVGGFFTHAFVNACCVHGDEIVIPKMTRHLERGPFTVASREWEPTNQRLRTVNRWAAVARYEPARGKIRYTIDENRDGFIGWKRFLFMLVEKQTAALSNYKQVPSYYVTRSTGYSPVAHDPARYTWKINKATGRGHWTRARKETAADEEQ